MDTNTGSDDAYFVDTERVTVPHPDTWVNLNFDQLIDVRTKLYAKYDAAKRSEAYRKPIQLAINHVQGLIDSKL